jgi:hypothetical protein
MKVAVVGSQDIVRQNIAAALPRDTTEIITGDAKGIDALASQVAKELGLPLTVILPDYAAYGTVAPLRRNDQIIDQADFVLVFWNGYSAGTKYVIEQCKLRQIPHLILQPDPPDFGVLFLDNQENDA